MPVRPPPRAGARRPTHPHSEAACPGAVGGVEAEQVVGDPLRVRRGPKHLLAVRLQSFQPEGEIGRGVGEVAGQAQLAADVVLGDLDTDLLPRVVVRAEPVAQVAVQPRRRARPVRGLVQDGAAPAGHGVECGLRRHLDVVGRRRVEGAIAAHAHDGAAVGDDGFDGVRRPPWRLGDRRRHERRRAFDLACVEQREGAQQWDAPGRLLRPLPWVGGVNAHFQPLEEVGRRAALAFPHLPAAVGRLLVGGPARVGAVIGERRHAEHDGVDAAIPGAGDRVAWHRRAARLVRIPRPAPGRGAGLEGRDHPLRDLGVLVAPLRFAPSALRPAVHGVSFPSRVC